MPNIRRVRRGRAAMPLAVLTAASLALPAEVRAAGDVQDQFYRHVEVKNKSFEPHLPGETVDHFTGALRIVQEDLFLPGKADLDLRIVRAYSSRIWGRADGLDVEPLLAEKDPSPLGYGWSIHMGRLQKPTATGQPLPCGGGDYPVYEAPDGSARTFYPVGGNFTQFVSRDKWELDTQCMTQKGPGACITTTTGDKLEFARSAQFDVSAHPVWPLTAHLDVFDNKIEVDYLSQGRIDKITDSLSREVTFDYSTCGPRQCLDSISAGPGGTRRISYGYTPYPVAQASGSRSFLTSVTPAVGPGYVYAYGASLPIAQNRYALSSITYPNGGGTAYTYDARMFFTGREDVPMSVVVSRTTSGRALPTATWMYEYDAPQTSDFQTTTVTRPDMLQDVHQFVGFGYPARMAATGHVWKVGLETRTTYANAAQIEESTWDKGPAVANANFAAPFYGSACPGWLWDTVVQSPILTKRVITRGLSRYEMEASGHDAYGQPGTVTETGEAQRTSNRPVRITTYKYDQDMMTHQFVGRVSEERVCQGTGSSDCMLTSRTFLGGTTRQMDSETVNGVTTRYRYYTDGDLESMTNALNQSLTLSQYSAGIPTQLDFNGAYTIDRDVYWDGSLRTESNGRGDVTTYTYDVAGRLETVAPPGTSDESTYTYDPAGARYTVTRGSGSGSFTETTELDGLGRVIETRTSLGRRLTREYDGMGRLIFTSYAFATGQPEVGDRFEFDGLDRPTTTQRRFVATAHRPLAGSCAEPNACRVVTSYLADHCRSTTVDRALNDKATTKACFDSFANPSEERLRGLTDAAAKSWSYGYDVAGNLLSFKAPKSAGNRTLTYTSRFFPESETSGPRGKTQVKQHDALGQPLEQVDDTSAKTTFEYESRLARPKATRYDQSGDHDVERTYDRDVLETVSSRLGGDYTYGYDEMDRTTSQRWVFQGHTYETKYEFDDAGCLETLTYPTGTKASMECDAQARPVKVDRVAMGVTQNVARNVVYHPMGRIQSMTFGNGRSVTTGITNGRVTSIRTPGVLDLAFAYDGADNVTRITDAFLPANTLGPITYDKLDRIFDVTTPAGKAQYRYDELGNRTQKVVPGEGTTNYHYDTDNRLAWTAGPSVMPVGKLWWTPAERLRETSDGAKYTYDALGRRVAKILAAEMIDLVYHYDLSGRLLAETKPDGTPVREYFYAADQLVAVHGCPAVNSSGCNVMQWYHTDHLGSVRARTDIGGTVVATMAYQPWGETPTSATGPALFNGRPFDAGLGLYDLGARAYSPKLGRFVSADTVWSRSEPQGSNPYAYVLNNPLKHTDPDGHVWQLAIAAGIGFAVGAGWAAYQYRNLSGKEYAARIAIGGVYGAVGVVVGGEILVVPMSHAANAAIDRAFGFEGPRGFKADAAPAPGDATRGPQRDKSYSGTGDMVQELLGTGRPPGSSPPPVKGIQGGKPVTPAPLSKTPDAGQPAKDKPQPNKGKQAPDAGKANDALPPQWLPGALGPKPELMP